ncbi:MAG: KH domain-containing protein [Clostridia bacterium]|nr:KH domain-containing protein [Clostridia bacterium]MBQ4341457.1 KH domain-containing protein [Clostridia bacterium]MBR6429375.1 KH domain-containing protein [Clostridia bacterium]
MEERTAAEVDVVALVEYIAKNLVDVPEEVRVTSKEGEDGSTVIELTVAKDDMGKVIGKQGRIAKAIRTVVRAATVKSESKYVVDIV